MKIKAFVSMNLVGCKREEVIEVEDDLTDDDIDEIVETWMHDNVEYGWKVFISRDYTKR